MTPPGDFEVSISGATRELLFRPQERASAAGLRDEFLVALRVIVARLQTDPVNYGEELFDLRAMGLTIQFEVELVRTFRFVPAGA